jgi:hypothetical protein
MQSVVTTRGRDTMATEPNAGITTKAHRLPVGTKSLLFGSHQFILHPLMVAWCWWRLYGFPWDPRLWIAFFVHDLGYWGKPNMDGPEGDLHPAWGAGFMEALFGKEWGDLVLYHSRFIAKRHRRNVSRLCAPDKLAAAIWPVWLYVLLASWSGEIDEYMERNRPGSGGKYDATTMRFSGWSPDKHEWYRGVADYLKRWAYEHRDGRYDTWTQGAQSA